MAAAHSTCPLCEQCGRRITRKRRGRAVDRDARRFCSKTCAGARRTAEKRARLRAARAINRPQCRVCGVRFDGRVYCSDDCRKQNARLVQKQRYGKPARDTTCQVCGTPMRVRAGEMGRPKTFCSSTCRHHGEAFLRGRRIARHARKARRRRVPYEPFDTMSVFVRDQWTCQLCGARTPKRLRGTHDWRAPELDHIVPLAAGGHDTYANAQCLCRRCNHAKGARVLGQLRLC